jgi:hypothetical protein
MTHSRTRKEEAAQKEDFAGHDATGDVVEADRWRKELSDRKAEEVDSMPTKMRAAKQCRTKNLRVQNEESSCRKSVRPQRFF